MVPLRALSTTLLKEHEHGICVVIFSARLQPNSSFYLEVYDPDSNLKQRIHPDA
jgi:hypothetical protein